MNWTSDQTKSRPPPHFVILTMTINLKTFEVQQLEFVGGGGESSGVRSVGVRVAGRHDLWSAHVKVTARPVDSNQWPTYRYIKTVGHSSEVFLF